MRGIERIPLWNERKSEPGKTPEESFQPYLELFLLPSENPRGMVIVCPGGAYSGRAHHEAEPVAEKFNSLGFHACVLQYRVAPYTAPAPMEDALRAVKLIRFHAEEWGVNPERIAVLGFSAGGHLAASTGILFNDLSAKAGDGADGCSARPDALILCYPVITCVPERMAHLGSFQNLLGKTILMNEEKEYYSWDRRANANTPPVFLWHTAADGGVPVYNSLSFAEALHEAGVDVELHLFPKGAHGLGLGTDDSVPEVRIWPDLAAVWLRKMGF